MNVGDFLPYIFAIVITVPFMVLFRRWLLIYIELKTKEIQILKAGVHDSPRSKAYERMMLFLERIKPTYLVTKFDKNLKPHEYLFLLEKSITEEFDYNVAQQLYISQNTWQNIVNAKQGILEMAHDCYSGLGKNATLEDFKTIFLMKYMERGDIITESQNDLKRELIVLTN